MRLLPLAVPLLLCPPVLAATGGPDAGDLVYTDSLEADGPAHAWLDADGGAAWPLGDDETVEVELPFSVELYGTSYDTVTISSNGALFFAGATTSGVGSCPGTSGSWTGIAAYWDDLGASTVHTETFGARPSRTFVVSWDAPHAVAGGSARFQAWLLEGRSEAVVVLDDTTFGDPLYDDGATAVVGVNGAAAGLPWSCSTAFSSGTTVWFGDRAARPARAEVETAELESPWSGVDDFDYAGRALAVGDVDVDGTDDALVGARDRGAGEVYLLQRPGVPGTLGDADATFAGGASGDAFGAALALGDLDGDGRPEAIVGAPGADTPGSASGAVYVWNDGPWGGAVTDTADDTWVGAATGRPAAGSSVAAGEDVNGDGYADLVVGAPYADDAATDAGAVYLVYGGAVGGGQASLATAADATFLGGAASDLFGASVALGDLDADGAAEIVAAATFEEAGATDSGRVYVLSGGTWSGSASASASAGCAFGGVGLSARLGDALLVADLDGSGLLDLAVGAPTEDGALTDAGATYVFYDPDTAGCPASALDGDARILGTASSADAGDTLAAGDVDGDGVDDLVIAASNMGGAVPSGGAVYVFTTAPSGEIDVDEADHALAGSDSAGALGTALAVADNDGDRPTLLMTAPYASVAYQSEGALYAWTYAQDFLDDDADGFVSADAGGNDCDDDDATAYPGGTDVDADSVDGDCDGWVDGQLQVRDDVEGWGWDVADAGGDTTVVYDFEAFADGDVVTATGDLTLVGDLVADDRVHGAWARDEMGARAIVGATNEVTLTFADGVDALAFWVLDPAGDFTLTATGDAGSVVDGYDFVLDGDDRSGGVFRGFVFADTVTAVTLSGDVTDGFGLDDVEAVLAATTDRDLDGWTDDEGDCDDAEAAINPGEAETLGNGVDDDCDGVVDAGSATTWTDATLWDAAAGIASAWTIDFEDVVSTEVVDEQYVDAGALFDGALAGDPDVDGTAPNDTMAASATTGATTIVFEEDQPAVALTLLDGDGTFTLTAYLDGAVAYTMTVAPTSERQFVGLTFDVGIDELRIAGPSGDAWGMDDVVFSSLGLDDADGDGLTEADGDCDDSDATVYPEATDTWYDGVDSDCAGDDDYDADADGSSFTLDCDDEDASVNPDATETYYDGIDSDCDGTSDYDADGDGHDGADWGGDDCDDEDAATSPDATETWYDGVDSDCAGDDDYDADGDGFSVDGAFADMDCDDTDASVSPDAEETWYDGVDSDCSGDETSDYDQDGDGHDAVAWGGDDCEDTEPLAYPGATGEACYDGVDTDCDGADDNDCDGDGYASDLYGGEDCDDTDPAVSPDAADVMGDGIDTNCDGAAEYDGDGDGHDDLAHGGGDCDDADPTVNPDAADACYDGVDSDCGGEDDDDCDGDGHASDAHGGDDCDDADASVHPDATDWWYDGIDQDCDGASDYDSDGDGHAATWYGGDDCDDGDADVSPSATEVCHDGIDADCDGHSDDDCDGDGYDDAAYGGQDCDDADAGINPGVPEVASDGIDQDCDGSDEVLCTDCDGDGHDAAADGGDDCDDDDATVHPEAADAPYDGEDSDCDGASDYDADGDGADAEAWGGGDCDDADPARTPGNAADGCGGGDDDCDGQVDEDCAGGDTGDTGDTGAPDTGDSGDTGAPDTGDSGDTGPDDTDWRPDADEPVDPEWIAQVGGCGGCATDGGAGTGAGGLAAAGIVLVALRRRRR